MKTIVEDFMSWIFGIQEDSPLPYEIKTVYFLVNFSNNACQLLYAGNEYFESSLVNFDYFPLEAQYFYNEMFGKITEVNLALFTLNQILDYSFDNQNFKKIFENKTVYIGEFGKKVILFNKKNV